MTDRPRCQPIDADGTKAIGCGPRAATAKDLAAVKRFAEFLRHQGTPTPVILDDPDTEVADGEVFREVTKNAGGSGS